MPLKIKPLLPGSVLHLWPKGTSPGAGWGLGCPTLPCLCPALLQEHGNEPPSISLLFKGGDLAVLSHCRGQGEMKYQQSNPFVVALIPPHFSQALGREGKDVGRNKGTGSPGIAGGRVTLQRYESALLHFHRHCRGSFLDNKVVRKRVECTFPLSLSSRWHLQGMMCLPCHVPPALKSVFAEPSALS